MVAETLLEPEEQIQNMFLFQPYLKEVRLVIDPETIPRLRILAILVPKLDTSRSAFGRPCESIRRLELRFGRMKESEATLVALFKALYHQENRCRPRSCDHFTTTYHRQSFGYRRSSI